MAYSVLIENEENNSIYGIVIELFFLNRHWCLMLEE